MRKVFFSSYLAVVFISTPLILCDFFDWFHRKPAEPTIQHYTPKKPVQKEVKKEVKKEELSIWRNFKEKSEPKNSMVIQSNSRSRGKLADEITVFVTDERTTTVE